MTRLLCLGDSITDCGRLWGYPPLGNGYVRIVADQLKALGADWSVSNCGVDGFTLARLLEHTESMYLPMQPDIITILIGINDIGLMMNTRRTERQKQEMLERFFNSYELLLKRLGFPTRRFILMEPFIFPAPAEFSTWLPLVRRMSGGIRKLAQTYHIPYLLLQDQLMMEAQRSGMDSITVDGIHLTAKGHEIVAQELFSVLYTPESEEHHKWKQTSKK